jgi:hypothetical protein
VRADTGSSGIWHMVPYAVPGTSIVFRHRMTSFEQLGVPPDLEARFRAWIDRYEHGVQDLDEFNRAGLDLARALKSFLGPNIHVEYEHAWWRDGDRPEATLIE